MCQEKTPSQQLVHLSSLISKKTNRTAPQMFRSRPTLNPQMPCSWCKTIKPEGHEPHVFHRSKCPNYAKAQHWKETKSSSLSGSLIYTINDNDRKFIVSRQFFQQTFNLSNPTILALRTSLVQNEKDETIKVQKEVRKVQKEVRLIKLKRTLSMDTVEYSQTRNGRRPQKKRAKISRGTIFKKNDLVWVVNYGSSLSKTRENRPFLKWKGRVVNSGRLNEPELQIVLSDVGWMKTFYMNENKKKKHLLFIGGTKGSEVFNTALAAKTWCMKMKTKTGRATIVVGERHVVETNTKKSPRVAVKRQGVVYSNSLPSPHSVFEIQSFRNSDAINNNEINKGTANALFTDLSRELPPILQYLGCKKSKIDQHMAEEINTFMSETNFDRYIFTRLKEHDATMPSNEFTPRRLHYSTVAGTTTYPVVNDNNTVASTSAPAVDPSDIVALHRYNWGFFRPWSVKVEEMPGLLQQLGQLLGLKYRRLLGNRCLTSCTPLLYPPHTNINEHNDGSSCVGGVENNSQVGHTPVVTVNVRGSRWLIFKIKGSTEELVRVEMKAGEVFVMSAECDRLLTHLTEKCATVSMAIVYRLLNQPRNYYRETGEMVLLSEKGEAASRHQYHIWNKETAEEVFGKV